MKIWGKKLKKSWTLINYSMLGYDYFKIQDCHTNEGFWYEHFKIINYS